MKNTSREVFFTRERGDCFLKNKLHEVRKARRLTQQQLADRVHVTSRTIIALEKGEYNPSLLLAYRLSLALEVPMEELFCLSENAKREEKRYESLP